MKFSLVLATLGRSHDLGRFFESAAAQTHRSFEVIVVDQNDDDRVVPYVKQARARGVVVLHLRSAPGLSRARNIGLLPASGDVIAFPDDDCWYVPDALSQASAAFSAHPEWDGIVARWFEQGEAAIPTPKSSMLSSERWRQFRDGDASSITLFLRRRLVERIGGFDESLGLGSWFAAAEETDLVLRALAADAVIVRRDNIVVRHKFASYLMVPAASQWRQNLQRSRGTGAIYVKHKLSPLVVIRGLVSPALKAFAFPINFGRLVNGFATSIGRIQGMLLWTWRSR